MTTDDRLAGVSVGLAVLSLGELGLVFHLGERYGSPPDDLGLYAAIVFASLGLAAVVVFVLTMRRLTRCNSLNR